MTRANEAAEALRRTLGEPIYNKTLRKEVGRGELDYEVYLRTGELLQLQTPAADLVVPDELLFQVVHQTQELWLKCTAYETANLVEQLDGDALVAALGSLDRIHLMTRLLSEQIRALFTLSPQRFQIIRRSLGNGSGLESPGYNHLLAAADAAEAALQRLIARRGATLLGIYTDPDTYADVHRIAERYVDWDGAFQAWLVEHFMLVRRTIGIDKSVRALDGFPTVALAARMTKPLFAELWNVRVEMTKAWSRDGGFAPGAAREIVEASVATPRASTIEMAPLRKIEDLRAEFPLLERCVYLNSNATGATPRGAKLALDGYWRTIENWRDEVWARWWEELSSHADEIAALIGAPPGSVVCDANLATLLGRVLSCFDYRARPQVVISDLEFPSVPFILRAFARYGLQAVMVPSNGVAIDVDRTIRAIDERVQLVVLSHATFGTGALLDVAPIVRRARETGALVALDAYQSVGIVPLDVAALDVDFVFGGAHKWLCGSYESAFVYVKPSLIAQLEPAATGWIASADPLSFVPPTAWSADARRFAAGTPAVLPALFSRPGLALIREASPAIIRSLSLAHTDRIIERADDAKLHVVTPRARAERAGIVALRFPGDAAVARDLVAQGYVCSYRGALRIAPHFYNTHDEIDRFMTELVKRAREAS